LAAVKFEKLLLVRPVDRSADLNGRMLDHCMKVLTHFKRDLVRVSLTGRKLSLDPLAQRQQANIRIVRLWALQHSPSENQTDWSAGAILISGLESDKPGSDQNKYSSGKLSKQLPHVSKIHSFLMLLF